MTPTHSADKLNEAQRRHLVAIFQHVDELLDEAGAKLGPMEAARLFPPYIADAAPIQRKLIADYARRVRAAMRTALERFGAPSAPPSVSGVWGAMTTLMAAQVAAAELAPRYMRGYGTLTEDAERNLRAIAAELSELLDQMESYLSQGPADMLQARLQRLEASGTDSGLLIELERIVSAHGLVQFRPALEWLVERMASGMLEVAVFGRVNSGKSSLLNYILQTSVLPVGVTPVTAVPVRIIFGKKPWGKVDFVDAAPEDFDLGRLAEFVSEQQNPSNQRHVSSLSIELPATILEQGIAFVDTPGVGSLGASGTAEALAYLPRCDLGLVLVDASSTLIEEDLSLVDALRHAGAGAMVLLSKADALEAHDRQKAAGYVQQELGSKLKTEVPVYPVSVKQNEAALCDHWLETALAPRLREHRLLAQQALARKLGLLRAAVRSALEQRLSAMKGQDDALRRERLEQADSMLGQALAKLDAARSERPAEIRQLAELADPILDEAAHNAALVWSQSRETTGDFTGLLDASLQSRAGVAAAAVARSVAELRNFVRAALAEARALAGANAETHEDLPRPSGLPVLDGAAVIPRTQLHRPALGFTGVAVLKHGIRAQLDAAGLKQKINLALAAYARVLENWYLQKVDEQRRAFVAQRELSPGRVERGSSEAPGAETDEAEAIVADLRKLRAVGHEAD